jgi:hypothetical protein
MRIFSTLVLLSIVFSVSALEFVPPCDSEAPSKTTIIDSFSNLAGAFIFARITHNHTSKTVMASYTTFSNTARSGVGTEEYESIHNAETSRTFCGIRAKQDFEWLHFVAQARNKKRSGDTQKNSCTRDRKKSKQNAKKD